MSVLGNGLGALPLVAAVAFGVGAIVAQSIMLFTIIKLLGAAYLIYLGIRTWRAVPRPVTEVQQQDASRHTPWALFRTGFLVSMSNPKAFIFFTALFPQFMDAHLPQGPQLAALAATFFVIESSWQFVYAAGGSRLAGWLNSARRLKLVNQVSGGAFVGAGVLLSGISRH